jgi:hypothetical protein
MRLAPAVACLALAILPHLPAPTSACADSPLRLNEIMAGPARDWDGSGAFSSRDDEWIELMNTGAVPLDLSGFLITDGDTIPRLALSGTLAAGARLVAYGKNSWDWEIAGAETLLVDHYTYRSHEAAADRAIGRLPEGGADWALFDGLNPYTGATPPPGNGCNPTPGTQNVCGETPVRATTWGSVKSLYR